MQTFADYLVLNANRYPDNIAIVHRDQRISYRELNQRINRLAHHLLDLGVRKGDSVGFMFYNSSQIVEIFYAATKIGAVSVPLNFRMIPAEVKWCLDNMKCKVFAYGESCAGQVAPVKNVFETVEHLIYSGEHPGPGEHDFDKFTHDGAAEEPQVDVGPDDKCLIILTGGTTGQPKGALHTHRSITFICLNTLINNYLAEPSETVVMQVPMFHIVGLNITYCLMAIGGKIVIVGESFDAREILRLIEKERATYVLLVPPATYTRLLDVPDFKNFDTTSVKTLHNTGGFLPQALMARLFDAFPNANIKYGYGQSESPVGTFSWITRSVVENNAQAVNSVGRASPFVEIRLVDEKGKEVAVGEPGEALIRGSHIMQGYFNQPDLTAETLKDGWVHTGDMFKRDKDGFYYFADRKKDVIKSGGENVFAAEVEGVILSHPSVETCAVIGIPDPKFGEAVMAVIKLRSGLNATEEEIIAHCKAHLSSYKKPRRVVFVEMFPRSEAGKVQKAKLREKYAKIEEA